MNAEALVGRPVGTAARPSAPRVRARIHSSPQIGRARLDDATMLTTAREALTTTRLGAFVAPGWATGKDLRQAVSHGLDMVRVTAHCTEVSVIEQHLDLARELGIATQAVLLMSHMAEPSRLVAECARAVEFGAQAVGIMDSFGQLLPHDVTQRVTAIVAAVDVPVIVHNNLAMALANSIAAVQGSLRRVSRTRATPCGGRPGGPHPRGRRRPAIPTTGGIAVTASVIGLTDRLRGR